MRAAARVHPRARAASSARACSRTCGSRCSGCGRGSACPALPPEIILLPAWVPLNVYDFACWARQTIVALSLVKAHRPVRPLPFDLDELRADGARRAEPRAQRPRGALAARGVWLARARPRCCAPTSAGRSAPLRRARARPRRALDRAPPGGRRLLGRHPAAVGLLADGAAPARLSARAPRDASAAWRASSASWSRTATTPAASARRRARAGAWKRASRRCGTRRWR